MSEYIEREALKEIFTKNYSSEYPAALVLAIIDNQPAADVAEVMHGKWIYKRGSYMTGGGNPLWCCSVCGEIVGASLAPPKYSYCHCGAKMDLGDEEE